MNKRPIPYPVIAYLTGLHEATIRRMAAAGRFGKVSSPLGRVRNRSVELAAIERWLGSKVDEAKIDGAWRLYNQSRLRIPQHVAADRTSLNDEEVNQ
jgi:hypothetical protein